MRRAVVRVAMKFKYLCYTLNIIRVAQNFVFGVALFEQKFLADGSLRYMPERNLY